jgi:Tfp pilus assembly protein FimT
MFKRYIWPQVGYTFVELVIVLAIISLSMVVLLAGAGISTKNERFTGEVKAFVNNLRVAQTKAYSVKGDCPSSAKCYWRGNVMEYQEGANAYAMYPLYGEDLSAVSGRQTSGITGKIITGEQVARYDLAGVSIDTITIGGSRCANCSIAFLAPDASSYVAKSWVTNFGAASEPYALQAPVEIKLVDPSTKLKATVTFNSVSGIIEYSIK